MATMMVLWLPLSSAQSSASKPELKFSNSIDIGLIDYPPHMDFKKGVNNSKLYQYISQTFENKGFKVTFRQFPNKRGKRELQEGNIDLLLPFDDDVDKNIRLLTKPLFHSTPGLCFKKEKFIPILAKLTVLKS